MKGSEGVLWLLQGSQSRVTLVPFPYHLDLYICSICLPALSLGRWFFFFIDSKLVIVKGHVNVEKSYHVQAPNLLEGFAPRSDPPDSRISANFILLLPYE